jgi:hypothetical protein
VAIFSRLENIFLCSGTLISSTWVVTSPICLLGVRDYSNLEIRIGDWDISEEDSYQETYEHFSTAIKETVFVPGIHFLASLKASNNLNNLHFRVRHCSKYSSQVLAIKIGEERPFL